MRNSLFAILMAATALIPGAAMAKRGDGDAHGWNRNDRATTVAERLAVRPARAERQQPQAQPQSRPQVQAPVRTPVQTPAQARPHVERGDGPRGERGGRGEGGNNRGALARREPGYRPSQPARPAPAVRADVGRGERSGYRGDDRGGRGDGAWRGGSAGQRDRGDTPAWRGNDGRGGTWRGAGRPEVRNGYRSNDRRDWNRNWRQDDRYDWNRRRQYDRNAFHLPRYYAPSGWGYGYRRFNIGFTLSSILFRQNYWISDADYYGLPEAYGPYRWVRYYNDALLVDIYTGQVVDTVYDIFW